MSLPLIPPGFEGRVRREEPMSRHTSWHVGGPADLWFEPRDLKDLQQFLRALDPAIPVTFVGLGSNLLVRDAGIRGAVVCVHRALDELERVEATRVRVGAGVPCAKLARQAARWGLAPAAVFAGLPGTVGGALAMNAGAWGGETWSRVLEVETIDRSGALHRRNASEYRAGYRSVQAPASGEWFVGATLGFERAEEHGVESIRDLLERRVASQPIGAWSCGSVFTNPPNDHAARLIEAAGLKGFRIGGAEVSVKHANFIINRGTATARDLEALIAHVRRVVREVHGVTLETEVRTLGEAA
ncbi:MAG: UDP-N-acetylmuramate dehydrogenase [Steroidobacteraceae bacterium]